VTSVIDVRAEQASDHPAIRALHAAAFPTDAEARLVDALRASARATVSLVAVEGGEVVGHVLFSPVTVARGDDGRGAGLAPVSVRASHRRRGIAETLIQSALPRLLTTGRLWCVVLGEPHYYERFGFERASDHDLQNEYGATDAFMALELVPGALADKSGLVRYAPEFAAFSV